MEPLSETRAAVLGETGVAIDGDIAYPHRTTALFKWAFDSATPSALKLPQGANAADARVPPVRGRGRRRARSRRVPRTRAPAALTRHAASSRAMSRTLRAGVLMPSDPVTLAAAPATVVLRHGARYLARLEACVDFLSARGWVHGDVKPSNIFIASDGEPWLGDFGSSVKDTAAVAEFPGGTPQYQVEGVPVDARDGAFDRASLVITFLVASGQLNHVAGSRGAQPWPSLPSARPSRLWMTIPTFARRCVARSTALCAP
jgi:hypothetical protein